MEDRGGRRVRRRRGGRRPTPAVRGGVAVHADRRHPGVPRLRRLLPERRRGRAVPAVEVPGLRGRARRVPRGRGARGRRAFAPATRPSADDAVPHRVRHRRVGADVGPAPRVRGAVVAPRPDARARVARRGARQPVAGGDVPSAPRLGGRVPFRGPRVGGADGEDRRGLVHGRHGGARERHGPRRAAVVRDGRRRHGVLPGQPRRRAAKVRPRGDVLRRGAVGERGAERDALVRYGLRRGRVRGQLPGRRRARQGHGRLPRPLRVLLRQRSARAGLPRRARRPAHPGARIPPGGHPRRRVRDASGPPGGAAGVATPPRPHPAHQPAGQDRAGGGPAAGGRVAAGPGARAAAEHLLPARAGLRLVRLRGVGLHRAAVPVGRGPARPGGAAADVPDVAELGRRAVRVQHAASEPAARRLRAPRHVLPQRRPERHGAPRHRDGVRQARRQAAGEGVRQGQLPRGVHGAHGQGHRPQDERERLETGSAAAVLQDEADEVGLGAGGADTALRQRRAHVAAVAFRRDFATTTGTKINSGSVRDTYSRWQARCSRRDESKKPWIVLFSDTIELGSGGVAPCWR